METFHRAPPPASRLSAPALARKRCCSGAERHLAPLRPTTPALLRKVAQSKKRQSLIGYFRRHFGAKISLEPKSFLFHLILENRQFLARFLRKDVFFLKFRIKFTRLNQKLITRSLGMVGFWFKQANFTRVLFFYFF